MTNIVFEPKIARGGKKIFAGIDNGESKKKQVIGPKKKSTANQSGLAGGWRQMFGREFLPELVTQLLGSRPAGLSGSSFR
jgi:hypothetical protein